MAHGDTVRVGYGNGVHGVADATVAVYDLERDEFGNIRYDQNGCAWPKQVGGVKGRSLGKVAGDPIRVHRSLVQQTDGVRSHGGTDYVMLFPVEFEYYQRVAFVLQDHVHVVHGKLT
jgi:hypothetical protein